MHQRTMDNHLQSILEAHKRSQPEESGNRFYQLIRVEGGEHFLEVQFRNGIRTAFAYERLGWFNYSPETHMLDMDFMGTTVSIEGRGLSDLFQALKSRKVSWIREADTDLQDHDANPVFVKEITITLPEDGFAPEPATP